MLDWNQTISIFCKFNPEPAVLYTVYAFQSFLDIIDTATQKFTNDLILRSDFKELLKYNNDRIQELHVFLQA